MESGGTEQRSGVVGAVKVEQPIAVYVVDVHPTPREADPAV